MKLFSATPGCPLFEGHFGTFAQALKVCASKAGYETAAVVAQAEVRTRKVMASCERDPVSCTTTVAHLLAAFGLPLAALNAGEPLRVLDFGGGLGGVYVRLGKFLRAKRPLEWDIVETRMMAEAGRRIHGEGGPRFLSDLPAPDARYHLLLASGSLQYVDDPVRWFERLCGVQARFLLLDQVPWVEEEADRLTVQTPVGAPGPTYPSWFFSRPLWMNRFKQQFELRMKWIHSDAELQLDRKLSKYEGLLLERK